MKKKTVKLSPLSRMLQFHKKSCSYYRYSDGEARLTNCSCGRDAALEVISALKELVKDNPKALELLG